MAIQPRLSTAEKVRQAANLALAAAEDMEIGSKSMSRVERLIDDVERAAKDMRAAVRGSGVR
ncbi:hypothetical protein [Sphingomonas sp. TREG-RG-20F-R18-01]|uniref:hypothetical protein n=1 Tax=Sphingomonas sp. TREG-RG-20F-R18-01 TaxID=2914982 RepID=UPI001F58B330|nr:hypothetical protein [Sphingomonas sp. TREG-RG-20F-R18-01]